MSVINPPWPKSQLQLDSLHTSGKNHPDDRALWDLVNPIDRDRLQAAGGVVLVRSI